MGIGGKIGLVAVLIVVVAIAAGGWYVWKRPLRVYAWFNTRALSSAGLVMKTAESPVGPQVFWTGGTGPTLVLLHGAGDEAGTWASVVPVLLSGHRLVIPNLAGHGASAPQAGPLSVGQVLAGLEAVLASTPGEPATIVGNSLGAWVALLYARTHPERVARLVLVNGGALRGDRPDVSLMPKNRQEAARLMTELRDPGSPPIPGFVLDNVVHEAATGPIARLAQTASSMEQYLLEGRLDQIAAPVDLVWGESDRLFPVAYANRMAAGLKASRLTVVPGCGHVPHLECPSRFIKVLDGVLGQAPPAPGAAR